MNTNKFENRHIGIAERDLSVMLRTIGVESMDQLIRETIPGDILLPEPLDLPEAMTERELLEHFMELGSKNKIFTSYIGQGWYDTVTPAPIQRNLRGTPPIRLIRRKYHRGVWRLSSISRR